MLRLRIALAALVMTGCSVSNNPAMPGVGAPFAASGTQSTKELVLDKFTSSTYKSNRPSPLTPDGAGNYYGTTTAGGLGYGTLYELSPNGTGGWSETDLHKFKDYLDGAYPQFTPLVFDKHGDLYGITGEGGTNGLGVAYRFHHTAHGWVEKALHNFGNGDAYPFNNLIVDQGGNVYGTDNVYHDGGAITEGVFEISPSGSGWQYKIIYDLGMPAANGGGGGLVMDPNGNIFGISSGFLKPAVVFELERKSSGWNPVVLYSFKKIATYPLGAPVLDKAGNIYGTTADGGTPRQGTVYKLKPSKSGPWTMVTLYAFKGGADGAGPFAGITFDGSGNIYGTTFGSASNSGTLFELAAGTHLEKVLWTFDGKDGSEPMAPVVLDSAGNLFGTTSSGGGHKQCYAEAGCGNAFEIAR
ncbi:MAG: choice-of-anchor tandem repeat GloVer-containing protein [Candidatus Tumulicola sp.]